MQLQLVSNFTVTHSTVQDPATILSTIIWNNWAARPDEINKACPTVKTDSPINWIPRSLLRVRTVTTLERHCFEFVCLVANCNRTRFHVRTHRSGKVKDGRSTVKISHIRYLCIVHRVANIVPMPIRRRKIGTEPFVIF